MHLPYYLRLLRGAQMSLADAFRQVAGAHADEPDIRHLCHRLAQQCDRHANRLEPLALRYGATACGNATSNSAAPNNAAPNNETPRTRRFAGPRTGGIGLLRDLQDVYLLAAECDICCTVVGQAARGARDDDLRQVVRDCQAETAIHLAWLRTRMMHAAPQALVVAD